MKIPPNDSSNSKKVLPAETDAVVLKRRAEVKTENSKAIDQMATQILTGSADKSSGSDQVDLTLGKYISEELNPDKIEAESKDRVAKFKALIESGQYKTDSQAVAARIANTLTEEISAEQFLSNNKSDQENDN